MKKNPWMVHLKKVRAKNPKMPYSQCMKLAKKSYKPKK